MLRTDRDALALQASEAQVMTCTVTIKTLRVGNRQLTQSVFKQLPTTELIQFRDGIYHCYLFSDLTAWGWVNYDLQHPLMKNFVTQRGGHLYRSAFWVVDFDEMVKAAIYWKSGRYDDYDIQWSLPKDVVSLFKNNTESRLRACGIDDCWDALIGELRGKDQLYIAA